MSFRDALPPERNCLEGSADLIEIFALKPGGGGRTGLFTYRVIDNASAARINKGRKGSVRVTMIPCGPTPARSPEFVC